MKHEIKQSYTLPYSANDMFLLINDIEKYPEFLPWCHQAKIHCLDEHTMTVSLTVAKAGITHTLTTKNHIIPAKKIEMRLISGPFKHLYGQWEFQDLAPNRCQINFDLEFSMASKLLALMFAPAFKKATQHLTEAFLERAKVCYGDRS